MQRCTKKKSNIFNYKCKPEVVQLLLGSGRPQQSSETDKWTERVTPGVYITLQPILYQVWLHQNYILTWKKLLTSPPLSRLCCPAVPRVPLYPHTAAVLNTVHGKYNNQIICILNSSFSEHPLSSVLSFSKRASFWWETAVRGCIQIIWAVPIHPGCKNKEYQCVCMLY